MKHYDKLRIIQSGEGQNLTSQGVPTLPEESLDDIVNYAKVVLVNCWLMNLILESKILILDLLSPFLKSIITKIDQAAGDDFNINILLEIYFITTVLGRHPINLNNWMSLGEQVLEVSIPNPHIKTSMSSYKTTSRSNLYMTGTYEEEVIWW